MPTRRMTAARLGKMPDDRGPALDLLVEPLERDWCSGSGDGGSRGSVKWARRSASASSEQLGDRREARLERVDDLTELLAGRTLVGLLEDRPDGRGDHAPRRARHEILGVAGEVDPAALPARAQELLADGLDQARVVVADDQAHAVEAAVDERTDERRPGRALVVAGRELDAEDPTLTAHGHAGRDQGRHRHDPAGLADLEIRRVEPDVRDRRARRAAGRGRPRPRRRARRRSG